MVAMPVTTIMPWYTGLYYGIPLAYICYTMVFVTIVAIPVTTISW